MISRALALLVAGFVLLVHDYGAEVRHRCEDRRPGTYGNPAFTAAECQPGVVPLSIREPRVQHRYAVAEHGAEAIHCLRREGDLRYQHYGAHPALQHHLPQEFQVHERLAASGDSVQQEGLTGGRTPQRVNGYLLRCCRRVSMFRDRRARGKRVAFLNFVPNEYQPALHQPVQHGPGEA